MRNDTGYVMKIKRFYISTRTFYEKRCLHGPRGCGAISELYTLFANQDFKLSYQLAWESDLGEAIEEDMWFQWSIMVHRGILNTSLVEANNKVLSHWWYLVPPRLAKIYPDDSPLCFRGCRQKGNMLNVWWSCLKVPKVQWSWTRIFNLLYWVECPQKCQNSIIF